MIKNYRIRNSSGKWEYIQPKYPETAEFEVIPGIYEGDIVEDKDQPGIYYELTWNPNTTGWDQILVYGNDGIPDFREHRVESQNLRAIGHKSDFEWYPKESPRYSNPRPHGAFLGRLRERDVWYDTRMGDVGLAWSIGPEVTPIKIISPDHPDYQHVEKWLRERKLC